MITLAKNTAQERFMAAKEALENARRGYDAAAEELYLECLSGAGVTPGVMYKVKNEKKGAMTGVFRLQLSGGSQPVKFYPLRKDGNISECGLVVFLGILPKLNFYGSGWTIVGEAE